MKTKLSWLETVLLTAPFVVLVIYWNDLPSPVPIHWNFRGQIDGWATKTPGIFIIPLTALGMTALLRVLPWFDPRLRRTLGDESLMPAVLPIIRLAVLFLLNTIFFVQIAASLGRTIPGDRIIVSTVLLFLIVVGNFLGNVRPNYFVGVRTPWTLENPETWRATHQLGGRLMFFGGLILFVGQFLLSKPIFSCLLVASILLFAAWGIVYSWHHSRTHVATR
jgi:immunity protein, SdpI family